MLVAQRSRELALFRALGASRRQVTRSVLFEAFVVGLLGSALGLGLGVLIALGIRALFASFGLDLSGTSLVFAARTPVAAFAVGLAVTMVAAYLPARRSSRIPPIAALRDDVAMPESSLRWRLLTGTLMTLAGVAVGAVGLFADVPKSGYWVGAGALLAMLGMAAASPATSKPFLWLTAATYRRVFGSVGVLAGQNSLRNPRRTAATASALMIGLTIVTTMSIAATSTKASVDETIARTFLGDIVISNAIGQGFSPQIATIAEKEPGVDSVTRLRYAATKRVVEKGPPDRTYLTGADPRTLADVVRLQLTQGIAGRLHRQHRAGQQEGGRRRALQGRAGALLPVPQRAHQAAHRRHPRRRVRQLPDHARRPEEGRLRAAGLHPAAQAEAGGRRGRGEVRPGAGDREAADHHGEGPDGVRRRAARARRPAGG